MKTIPACFRVARLAAVLSAVLVVANCALPQLAQPDPTLQGVLESYREQVFEVIKDPERAGNLVALGEDVFLRLQTDTEELREMAEEFERQNARYAATREELASLTAAMNRQRGRMSGELLAARARAVSLTTPEEWRGLMARREKLLELLRATPGLF